MKITENFIRQKLTYKVFLSMSFLVISLPILFNFKYLLLGEKVKGVMMRASLGRDRQREMGGGRARKRQGDRNTLALLQPVVL